MISSPSLGRRRVVPGLALRGGRAAPRVTPCCRDGMRMALRSPAVTDAAKTLPTARPGARAEGRGRGHVTRYPDARCERSVYAHRTSETALNPDARDGHGPDGPVLAGLRRATHCAWMVSVAANAFSASSTNRNPCPARHDAPALLEPEVEAAERLDAPRAQAASDRPACRCRARFACHPRSRGRSRTCPPR